MKQYKTYLGSAVLWMFWFGSQALAQPGPTMTPAEVAAGNRENQRKMNLASAREDRALTHNEPQGTSTPPISLWLSRHWARTYAVNPSQPVALVLQSSSDTMINANQIKPHTPIVCSENGQFGIVDHMEGADTIKVTKDKHGQHHYSHSRG